MEDRLKNLMQELGNAINDSLSDSDRIAEAIGEIKQAGYDVFLVLEATIGFNRNDDQAPRSAPELVSTRNKKNPDPEFDINANDVRFLKSLRISVDDAA